MHFKDWDTFRKALSLAHTLQNRYAIWGECKDFWNKHVDFIGSEMDAAAVIATMHQVTLLIVGNMAKYYKPEHVSMVLQHALRHCVRSPVDGFLNLDFDVNENSHRLHGTKRLIF